MSSRLWPEDTSFEDIELVPQVRTCEMCGAFMTICDHRFHPISTLSGPKRIVAKLVHCSNKVCPARKKTHGPEEELLLALPGWSIGWDVFAYIGYRRFKHACTVKEIHEELRARFDIVLSVDAVGWYVRRYQTMLSAKWTDLDELMACYRDTDSVVLTIDGLKPDQTHETLYVVRELTHKRIWFAATLKASDQTEIDALFQKAHEIVTALGVDVRAWMSDKQEAFKNGVEKFFPGKPHLLCRNHFLRKLAEPVAALDKKAVKTLRDNVRGLREIERKMEAITALPSEAPVSQAPVLKAQAVQSALDPKSQMAPRSQACITEEAAEQKYEEQHRQQQQRAHAVLDYATVLRGVLSDSSSGPLQAASVTMTVRLTEVNRSMQRCIALKKGGPASPR